MKYLAAVFPSPEEVPVISAVFVILNPSAITNFGWVVGDKNTTHGRLVLFEHVPACMCALHARLGTCLHLLVLGKFFTLHSAVSARLCASFTNVLREWPAPRDDLRSGRTDGRAILTGGQGGQVLLLAVLQHVAAETRAYVAGKLTFRTRFRTRFNRRIMLHVPRLFIIGSALIRKQQHTCENEAHCSKADTLQNSITHNKVLSLEMPARRK